MAKSVQLEIHEPFFSPYQTVIAAGIVMGANKSAYNQVLNNCVSISGNRNFLKGHTGFFLTLDRAGINELPIIERYSVSLRFASECCSQIIKNMIDNKYYVYFNNVDDYYLPGKSWYGTRHLTHDGIICGYDDGDASYTIRAYDINWVDRAFRIPQNSFREGVESAINLKRNPSIFACKVKEEEVKINVSAIIDELKKFLFSDLSQNPTDKAGKFSGVSTYDYFVMYMDKLLNGDIPHEKMDWRPMRTIWEHKKCMLDRIKALEEIFRSDNIFSETYLPLVKETDKLRMQYAFYHKKQRDSVLQSIKEKFIEINDKEKEILKVLIERGEKYLAEK